MKSWHFITKVLNQWICEDKKLQTFFWIRWRPRCVSEWGVLLCLIGPAVLPCLQALWISSLLRRERDAAIFKDHEGRVCLPFPLLGQHLRVRCGHIGSVAVCTCFFPDIRQNLKAKHSTRREKESIRVLIPFTVKTKQNKENICEANTKVWPSFLTKLNYSVKPVGEAFFLQAGESVPAAGKSGLIQQVKDL